MSKGIIVQKFGGTSVADVDRIRNVAKRVVATRKKGYEVVVVVSALGDTTDNLMALHEHCHYQLHARRGKTVLKA